MAGGCDQARGGQDPDYLTGHRRRRVDERRRRRRASTQDIGQERIVGAAEDDGVDTGVDQRGDAGGDCCLDQRPVQLPGLDQLDESPTHASHYRDPGAVTVDHRGVQLALEGGRGGEHPDHAGGRSLRRRLHRRLHPDERHLREGSLAARGAPPPRPCYRRRRSPWRRPRAGGGSPQSSAGVPRPGSALRRVPRPGRPRTAPARGEPGAHLRQDRQPAHPRVEHAQGRRSRSTHHPPSSVDRSSGANRSGSTRKASWPLSEAISTSRLGTPAADRAATSSACSSG